MVLTVYSSIQGTEKVTGSIEYLCSLKSKGAPKELAAVSSGLSVTKTAPLTKSQNNVVCTLSPNTTFDF